MKAILWGAFLIAEVILLLGAVACLSIAMGKIIAHFIQ